MVVYTLDSRFNSITLAGSKYLGAPITFYDVIPLLTGRDPAAERAAAAGAIIAAAAAPACAAAPPTSPAAPAPRAAAPLGVAPDVAALAEAASGPRYSFASTDSGGSSSDGSSSSGAPVTVELIFRGTHLSALGRKPFELSALDGGLRAALGGKGAVAAALARGLSCSGACTGAGECDAQSREGTGKRVRWMPGCAAAFDEWGSEAGADGTPVAAAAVCKPNEAEPSGFTELIRRRDAQLG
jgi:hypothetical protein